MINYSYDDKTNIVLPCIDFISIVINGTDILTCKSKDLYKINDDS